MSALETALDALKFPEALIMLLLYESSMSTARSSVVVINSYNVDDTQVQFQSTPLFTQEQEKYLMQYSNKLRVHGCPRIPIALRNLAYNIYKRSRKNQVSSFESATIY